MANHVGKVLLWYTVSVACATCGVYLLAKAIITSDRASGSPSFFCSEPVHDFGQVTPAALLRHRFVIDNTGNMPLHISRIQTSCGCVTAKLASEEIAPGQSATLDVEFKAPLTTGKASQHLLLHTDDPRRPERRLTLLSLVEPQISLSPDLVDFGLVADGETVTPQVTVVVKLHQNGILSVTSEAPGVSAAWLPESEDSGRIVATLNPAAPIGPISGDLNIAINDIPRIRLPVIGRVTGDVYSEPTEAFLGICEPRQQASTDLVIKSRTSGLVVREIVSGGAIKSMINTQLVASADHEIRVRVSLDAPEMKAGRRKRLRIAGHLLISLGRPGKDAPIMETLHVPVLAFVRSERADLIQNSSVPPVPLLFVPGQGIGEVSFGMGREEIIARLGEPGRITDGGGTLMYPQLGMSLLIIQSRGLQLINCYSKQAAPPDLAVVDFAGQTAEGVAMGSKLDQIISSLGEPDSRIATGDQLNLTYKSLGLQLILYRGQVVQMMMLPVIDL